ncbi:MAG: response regulator [Dehalococcoidia bacterium]|nr:response regulator [Dehalococcoidia bacterium]
MPVRPDQESEATLRLLADAGTLLSATLDTEQTLDNLAHLIVPRFADWCTVDLTEGEEWVRRLSVVCNEPAQADLARRVLDQEPRIDASIRQGSPAVIVSGDSVFVPVVDDEALNQNVAGEHLREAYREADVSSLMIVPISAKGNICGAIHVGLVGRDSWYTASDLLIAEDLGRRAGLAIDNAQRYEESREIAEELQRANDAKDEFLGMISHELRTPITVIHGGARILRLRGADLDDETRDELVADIEEESDRLHRIVENLLALSRAEMVTHFQPEPVMLQRVVRQMAEVFERQRRQRPVTVDADETLPPAAADQGFIEQILRNLLSNADKYSPPNEPVDIRVTRDPERPVATVEVADRGGGISQEEIERIFDRFYRSPSAHKGTSGAGMGLAVCKRLAEAMAGSICGAPARGRWTGACVHRSRCTTRRPDMSSAPLVLAVDDEPGILRLLRIELESQGFKVITATSGDEALRAFEQHRPDLVLLDVLMPEMDGHEVMRRLRERSTAPIIMVTAKDADADKVRGLSMGADDYVVKPFNPDELAARIEAVLRRAVGAAGAETTIYVQGGVSIDLERRLVTRGEETISLTRTEWMLLQHLATNAGKVILNSELLTKVWGPEYRDDLQYLRVWVSRLRHKLEPDPSEPQIIKTHPGIGYILEASGTSANGQEAQA